MTSILRRLTLIIKVWMNKLLAPAQDPRQVFADAYQRQQATLLKVRQAMANV
ncbi:MAG: PspA/IM30 family protein, partial [Chloroflexi bacterium]|nr:PspA/IM30 family protein [Chloroflexota bacterium]